MKSATNRVEQSLETRARLCVIWASAFITLCSGCLFSGSSEHSRSTSDSVVDRSSIRPSAYRGWDFLAKQLETYGVSRDDIRAIYQDPRMPLFTFVPFSLRPKEASSIYSKFRTPAHQRLGARFIEKHKREFDRMERTLKVPSEVVAAILVVESHLGQNTGRELVIYRLSRVASVCSPENLEENYTRIKADDPTVQREELRDRAAYLERTFLPEIPALIEISKRNKIDVFSIKGSTAGAFGLPQFLPSALIKYGYDGNRDGSISLFNEIDAIWSTGNYLGSLGYRDGLSQAEKRAIIWRYNKSEAYIDTILLVARGIRQELRR